MTLEETLAQLESLGKEKVRAQNSKSGASANQFGVLRGDVRKLAAKIKNDPELAIQLWATGKIDAQFLGSIIIRLLGPTVQNCYLVET